MVKIILPDGTKVSYRKQVIPSQIAEKLHIKNPVAAMVNGELVDLDKKVTKDASVEILTLDDKQGLEVLRHSAGHILALAVKRMFPEVRFGIGPAIENGFYYDFDKKVPFRPGDLAKIEEEMRKIVAEDLPFKKIGMTKARAKKVFADQPYKLELLEDLKKPSAYRLGEFTDLCKGPHVPSAGYVKAFKLIKTAGAYWKGDVKNKQLQRVYGVAFKDEKELARYLHMMEEAEKRDHRQLGKELDLYSFHTEAPGMVFMHPNGMILLNNILDYWREEHERDGYQEIRTPIILSKRLWEQSGHWEYYKDNMYLTKIDDRDYAIKPMNCPASVLVFKERLHSYKELPIRWAELGLVHRHELSGVLSGLFRVREFIQDDAHIYCTKEQIEDEVARMMDLFDRIYKTFGLKYHVELSTRPEKFMGSPEIWNLAEEILQRVLKAKKVKFILHAGEGTFYGPKIDFHLQDALNRTWQCGTIQLDFQMPEKFNVTYEGADGKKHQIIMLHRALLGSLERFLGILVEHYAGKFPLWLAPEQVRIFTVSDKFDKYAEEVKKELEEAGLRVYFDNRAETVGYKVRDAQQMKVPYVITIGEKEKKSKSIAIRTRDNKVKMGQKLKPFVKQLLNEVEERR